MESLTPLIFIPGLGDDEALWQHQVASVRELCTPKVVVLDRQEALQEMAEVVLSSIDGRFALAGFSMGGRVSLEVMRSAPERVTRLALVSSSAQPGRKTISAPYRGTLEQIIETEFIGVLHEDACRDPKIVEAVRAMVRRRGAEGLARQQRSIMASAGHMGILGEIRCPTLVICGRDDPVTPTTRSEEIAAGIPNATLHVLNRCGHYAPLERAERVSALLRAWLAEA